MVPRGTMGAEMATAAALPMETFPRKRFFNVDEYHQMAKAGILAEDDRVELIEGEVVQMAPVGVKHAGCVRSLTNLLIRLLGEKAVVDSQNPLVLTERTEPQPDVVVLRPRDDLYRKVAIKPEDVLLLIEVADSSLPYDRDVKMPLYARSGIPEMWLIDLQSEEIEVLRQPTQKGFQQSRRLKRGQDLSILAFPDLKLTVELLLGPPS